MALGYVLSSIGGVILGLVVNLLADRLPALAARDDRQEAAPGGQAGQARRDRIVRYAAVVLAVAALTAYLWGREGLSWQFAIYVFYVAVFALIAVIDMEHRLILSVVMIPAFAVALVEVLASGRIQNRMEALAGYAIGQVVVMAIYLMAQGYLWVVNRRRENPVTEVPFGFGDVTLATFCGLVLGYPRVVLMLVLMILLGGLFAVLYIVFRAVITRSYQAHAALPYGPAILTAALIMLLWGEAVARFFGAS
jgi:prepilin signal peptidase PulO-like enzyme (type II secretory pathway)